MALEKRNPLPLGRYWVDIQAKYVPDFQQFLGIVGRGIFVAQTKEREDPFTTAGKNTGYLFDVRDPLISWDATKYGYPTIGTGITDLDQTGTVPAAEPLIPPGTFGDLSGSLLILAALWLLASLG
jgi:hypothetical protein